MRTPTTFSELINLFLEFINYLIPLIFGVLFVIILWKIIDVWVINAGDEKKVGEGKTLVLTAVLVFVLMISTWGIIAMLRASFFGS